jgi:hypothetical protein
MKSLLESHSPYQFKRLSSPLTASKTISQYHTPINAKRKWISLPLFHPYLSKTQYPFLYDMPSLLCKAQLWLGRPEKVIRRQNKSRLRRLAESTHNNKRTAPTSKQPRFSA